MSLKTIILHLSQQERNFLLNSDYLSGELRRKLQLVDAKIKEIPLELQVKQAEELQKNLSSSSFHKQKHSRDDFDFIDSVEEKLNDALARWKMKEKPVDIPENLAVEDWEDDGDWDEDVLYDDEDMFDDAGTDDYNLQNAKKIIERLKKEYPDILPDYEMVDRMLQKSGISLDRLTPQMMEFREEFASVLSFLPPGVRDSFVQKFVEDSLAESRRDEEGLDEVGHFEFCGLSQRQIVQLMKSGWDDPDGPIYLNPTVPYEEVKKSIILGTTIYMLSRIAEKGVPLDGKFMNPGFVMDVLEHGSFPESYKNKIRKEHDVVHEDDVIPVLELRELLHLESLISVSKKSIRITPRGKKLLPKNCNVKLYMLLFKRYAQDIGLALGFRGDLASLISQSTPFLLYAVSHYAENWTPAVEPVSFLAMFISAQPLPGYDVETLPMKIANSLIIPLLEFGLLELEEGTDIYTLSESTLIRKSPLFDQFIHFHIQ